MTPVQGRVYTFAEVSKLDLLDSPSLCLWLSFEHPTRGNVDVDTCIQTAGVPDDGMLLVPGMSESKWRYIRTTSEWIPIFRFVGENPANLVDVQLDSDFDSPYSNDNISLWLTPKGHKRPQYNNVVREGDTLYICDGYRKTRKVASSAFTETFNAVEKAFGIY